MHFYTSLLHYFTTLVPLLKSQSVSRAEKMKRYKILKGPVVTSGAEFWTLNKDVANRLAAFGRKLVRRMFGGIKVNGNWRK